MHSCRQIRIGALHPDLTRSGHVSQPMETDYFFPIRWCKKGVGFIGDGFFGVTFENCFMLVEFDVTCHSCWDKKGTLYLGRDLGTDAD